MDHLLATQIKRRDPFITTMSPVVIRQARFMEAHQSKVLGITRERT